MNVRCVAAMLLALVAVACEAAGDPTPPPLGPGVEPDDTAEDESSESSTGEEPVVGPCEEVDLLFVIDNSGSMADEQAELIGSFPGFIDGIEHTLGRRTSYHVGVVTTDVNVFNDAECRQLGALTTKTGGEMSSASECGPYAEGARFMTTQDDLGDAFACAAQVGIAGVHVERPMAALEAALHGDPPETAACNDGFLREDALLVVVLITDEDDDGDSQGDPARWYDRMVAAKGGDPERIVVLSLVGKSDECTDAEPSPRLIDFTQRFPYGFVRDVCSSSYADDFADVVAGIDDACAVTVG